MTMNTAKPTNQAPGSLMTLKEVAQYLRLSEDTVYKKANESSIPSFKIGKQWRFRRNDIDEWLERQAKRG